MTYSEKEIEYALQIIHHRNELDDLEVSEWLKSSEHQQLLEELALWGRACGDGIVGNVEEAKSVVAVKIKRRRLQLYVRLFAIAASVVVFFMVGILLLTRQETTITIAEAEKGNYISLTLANGEVVNLEQQRGEVFRGNAGVIVNDSLKGLACGKIAELHRDTAIAWNVLKVPVGQTYHISLADGTQVWLNAATELQFPTRFCKNSRRVRLRGEAYFEVSKNVGRPFIVEATGVEVQVLGTEFDVRAYPDEDVISTTLVEGQVRIAVAETNVALSPMEQAVWIPAKEKLEVHQVDVESLVGWKNGRWVFDKSPICIIMKELSRWYDLKVEYSNEKSKYENFSLNLEKYDDFKQILSFLEETGNVRFALSENTVIVY